MNPIVELVLILVIAFGLAFAVQSWVVKPYSIPSGSMEPTLQPGDRVLANRFIYHLHPPRRGDVVVFHPPGHGDVAARGSSEASVNFIKRIIGLPGDTVRIKLGLVSICPASGAACFTLHEPYVNHDPFSRTTSGPYHVPKGDYFVMGDNRGNSDDSRVWGMLPARNIIGKAFVLVWPLNRLGTL